MGRHALPHEVQEKIRTMDGSGGSIRGIAKELNLSRVSVERILKPDQVKRREKKKRYGARLIRLDKRELPPDNFDVYAEIKYDWLTG